jgi:hypothetical protein
MKKLMENIKIKIEKNVAIPKQKHGTPALPCPYPLLEMEVGDSFFIKCDTDAYYGYNNNKGKLQYQIRKFQRIYGNYLKKFTVRAIKTPIEGYRCWRIK